MALHSFELQKTVFTALNGRSITNEQGASISGVFDDVPAGTAYPYIRIGEETVVDNATKTLDSNEHTITIHCWSQYAGMKEIKLLMQQVYTILHDSSLSVSGANLINLRHEFETTLLEGDGITRHGVMRFRAVLFDT